MRRACFGLSLVVSLAASLGACTTRTAPLDSGPPPVDAGRDANLADAGPLCGCTPGPHNTLIFALSDEGALWSYDPIADNFELVLGPVCPTTDRAFSMAVDPRGRAWIEYIGTRRIQLFDLVSPGACTDSGYLPTSADFPLFGMGFAMEPVSGCAALYAHSYSGSGPFAEGPGLGSLGVIDGEPPRMRTLAPIDFDGGELTGTGDGRVFAFTGVSPAKLVEYDRTTGEPLEVLPLVGFSKTNASAFAFFAGDFYLFTEAPPPDCFACFETECASAWTACQADTVCTEQVACAIDRGDFSDACGGGATPAMAACFGPCSAACLVAPSARHSQVARLDWDRSDGPERALTVVNLDAPIRVVGAGTSPCVPTIPF